MPAREYFTLDEANALIKTIAPLLVEVLTIRERILARSPELWATMERAAGNGGSRELTALAVEFDRLNTLVHAIMDTGAEIKDLSVGLIDFRARRRGTEVYLCWKLGEERIGYWHQVETGFEGRRPIAEF